MAKDPRTFAQRIAEKAAQKAAQETPTTNPWKQLKSYIGSDRYYENVKKKQKKYTPGSPDYQRYQEILDGRKSVGKQASKAPAGFKAEFRKRRNDYLNDRSKKKTFEWEGNKYHVRIKGETPAMLKTQRDKTLSGAFKKGAKTTTTNKTKTTKRKTFREKRLERLKKRAARAASKGRTGRAGRLQKRIGRVQKRIANKKKTSTNKTPIRVKTSLAQGGWIGDLKPPQIKKPVKVKSKKAVKTRRPKKKLRGGIGRPIVDRLPIMLNGKLPSPRKRKTPPPPEEMRDLGLRNRPEKRLVRAMKPGAGKQLEEAVMRSRVAKNKKNMDLPPRRRQGVSIKGYKRGDLVQGYDDRLHESLGARHPGKKTQSLKSRSNESKGAEKAAGKRAYASVKTMDKGTRKAKPRGVGVAKRGYGKALS